MARLFERGALSDWLERSLLAAVDRIEKLDDDEILARSRTTSSLFRSAILTTSGSTVVAKKAESINRGIEDHLDDHRAHSVGALRQHFDLIAHARNSNALAVYLHRQRQVVSLNEAA